MALISRTERGRIARWWWTVDHWTLGAIASLAAMGILLSLAASPAVADRIGVDSFYFVYRQLSFIAPSILVIFVVSLLEPRDIIKLSAAVFGAALVAMAATLFIGPEIKGATRWLHIGPLGVQPSEFVKPALVVLAAWALTARSGRNASIGVPAALGLFVMTVGILVLQPDFGQAMLVTFAFAALLFFWGVPWFVIMGLAGALVAAAFAVYSLVPHVASRVNRFLDPSAGDTFQVDTALSAFAQGGAGGVGPGEGTMKYVLPDAHTDFIFAVAGEEFGLAVCFVLLAAFALIVFRGLSRATQERDRFTQLAAAGLVVIFGAQAIVNIAVNLSLMPAKGMTLPFVSYGGSSMLALALTAGMILSLTRRRPNVSPRG
jgi:cell division protein FtsW